MLFPPFSFGALARVWLYLSINNLGFRIVFVTLELFLTLIFYLLLDTYACHICYCLKF